MNTVYSSFSSGSLTLEDVLPRGSVDSEYFSSVEEIHYGGSPNENELLSKIEKLPAYERFVMEFLRLQLKSKSISQLESEISEIET